MAMTATINESRVDGIHRVVAGVLTMDASYPNPGGLAFPLTTISAKSLIDLDISPGQGVLLRWDQSKTAPKVQAYRDNSAAANAALPEVANGQSLSTITANYRATVEF